MEKVVRKMPSGFSDLVGFRWVRTVTDGTWRKNAVSSVSERQTLDMERFFIFSDENLVTKTSDGQ
jgi:hypothetical protein